MRVKYVGEYPAFAKNYPYEKETTYCPDIRMDDYYAYLSHYFRALGQESVLAHYSKQAVDDQLQVIQKFLDELAEPSEEGESYMKARFKGDDYSRGYRKGKIYDIKTKVETVPGLGPKIVVQDMDGDARNCPYDSVEAFLRNWEPIKGGSV